MRKGLLAVNIGSSCLKLPAAQFLGFANGCSLLSRRILFKFLKSLWLIKTSALSSNKVGIVLLSFNFNGIEFESYVLSYDKDKATGYCPVNKQSHLRPLATINQVNKCISILKSKPKIKRSMWSRRAQEYEAKISSGKIYDLAEVVRDLNKGDDLMIDQSYSERQLFEKAYDRLLIEFQIVMGTNLEDTQKKLDKALKRNLEKQNQKIEQKPKTEELPEQELAE